MKSNVETVQTKMSDEPHSTGKIYLVLFFSKYMKTYYYERLSLLNLLEFLSCNRVRTLRAKNGGNAASTRRGFQQ